MNWIENKYASLLNSRVRNYKRKSSNLWNFSCPLCGDSEKNPRSARGYIYESKGKLRFHCHNCSADRNFDALLREIDEALYLEMKKELLTNYKEENKPDVVVFTEKLKKPAYVRETNISELPKISQLSPNHYCKKYVVKRGLPTTTHHELFYAQRFKEWTNSMLPGKFDPIKYEESRLVIPFFDRNKKLIGYQGRSLEGNKSGRTNDNRVKYITIMLDNDCPRVYGLDKVDFNRKYYAVEGPFDAMFLNNSIASCGSDIVSELEKLKCNKENGVIIYDNEPRNKDTIKKIARAIRKGWKVVIWPTSPDNKEDINDLALSGIQYMETINSNIYNDLTAMAKLSEWKRI